MTANKTKTIISYLFSFFIAFFMFVIVLLLLTRATILSPSYFLKQMNATQYYENTAIEINRTFKQNAAPSGFPVAMFDSYLKEEDIREDMIQYQKNMMGGKKAEMPTEKIEQRLRDDTNAYILEHKIELSPSIQIGIDTFIQSDIEQYIHLTQFPYIDIYGKLTSFFHKVVMIVVPVLCVVTAILFLALHKLHNTSRRRKRYYAYAWIGAGLMISALPFYLYVAKFFEKIELYPKYIYQLLVSLFNNYLVLNMVVGLVMGIIGLAITYAKKKKGRSIHYYRKA